MSNFQEIITKDLDSLQDEVDAERHALLKLRFRQATDQLKDYSQLKKTRHKIAQLLTAINFHKRAIAVAKKIPQIERTISKQPYTSKVEFQYDENIWMVSFHNNDGEQLETVKVKL